MGAPNYITDNKGNIVYPRTLAKCVKKGVLLLMII